MFFFYSSPVSQNEWFTSPQTIEKSMISISGFQDLTKKYIFGEICLNQRWRRLTVPIAKNSISFIITRKVQWRKPEIRNPYWSNSVNTWIWGHCHRNCRKFDKIETFLHQIKWLNQWINVFCAHIRWVSFYYKSKKSVYAWNSHTDMRKTKS